jgi:hypothetical protein
MGLYDHRPCPCGSGKPSSWVMDARGIPLKRTCEDCHTKVMATYRPEVLTNPDYNPLDDVIEPEEEF